MGKNMNEVCGFVFICQGKDCVKAGGKDLYKASNKLVKDKKLRNQVQLVKTKCTGHCKEGPIVISGEKWFTKANAKKVEMLLDKFEK